MNENIRTVFIIGKLKGHALNTLKDFRSEFNEYVKTYNEHLGQVTLINGIDIIAIGEEEKHQRLTGMHNGCAMYGAEWFMSICYKNAYHAAKKEIDISKGKMDMSHGGAHQFFYVEPEEAKRILDETRDQSMLLPNTFVDPEVMKKMIGEYNATINVGDDNL